MNTAALVPRLVNAFQRCTKVSEASDIYRCEHNYKDTPRSVYFFKEGSDLPSPEELSQIHQDIVGPSYFMAKDASRWNHYLVFVADDNRRANLDFGNRRGTIEANMDYARKLVVFDSELDEFIDRSITPADANAPAQTVVAIWNQKLTAAGLSQIQTNSPRAPLIRAIRKGAQKLSEPAEKPTDDPQKKPQQVHLIKRFVINRFGDRRVSGSYEFGRVNLIRGSNGSGKTSLLEAIEHFFCGATYRSNGQDELFKAEVVFAGRPLPVPFRKRTNNEYQERDQRWYGRTVNRGNRLWEGFSRFNFLNTDAAVHFSTDSDQQDLTDALSKIALGPEAAFTWHRIGEFDQDLAKELGPIGRTISGLERTISVAKARETVLKSASPQIEASIAVVHQILLELRWTLPATIPMPPDAQWFIQFQPLREFVSAIRAFDNIRSIDDLDQMVAVYECDLQKLQTLQDVAKSADGQQASLRAIRSNKQVQINLLIRLGQFLDSELLGWIEEENRLQTEISRTSKQLIALGDLDLLEEVTSEVECLFKTTGEFEAKAEEQITNLRNQNQALESARAVITRQMDLVDTIVSQIRSLGHEYVEKAPQAEECPLCRTHMEMAELVQKIQYVGNQPAQAEQLKIISKDISVLQSLIDKFNFAVITIRQFHNHADDQTQLLVADQILHCRSRYEVLQALNAELMQARSQRETKERAGFDAAELSDLRAQFDATLEWKHLSSANLDQVRELREALKMEESSIKQKEAQLQIAMTDTAKNLQLLLDAHGVPNGEVLRQTLQTSVRALGVARTAFDALPDLVRQQFSGNLADLAVLCGRAITTLDDLSGQLQVELGRNKELNILKHQLAREQTQLSSFTDERDRLKLALDVLRGIKENHSLEAGLSSFLSSNLVSIQRIFSKIHVPHELRLSSLDGGQLERTSDGHKVKLNQISTGQRAALMLSIFLTLNLSLRNGPPQVLIDDPVAHIDDLNSLSFLDYLADIAESGKRQIFFATADDKLANLFQKKMEFLGNDFRTIELKPGQPQSLKS